MIGPAARQQLGVRNAQGQDKNGQASLSSTCFLPFGPQGSAGRGHLSGRLVALAWEGDENNVTLPLGCVGAALKSHSHKMVLPVETSQVWWWW